MAALSSADARGPAPAERFRFVRPLGARAVAPWAALDASAGTPPRLVIVERASRGGEHGDQEIGDWVRDARRIATLEHPNLGRIRDVVIAGDEVCVISDYLDGARWTDLLEAEPRPPLESALRALVDVLTGLSAIHNLRDANREPLKLVHGELTPECILVGADGMARVVGTARPRSATARAGHVGSAYLAPEILLADESADARADVYGVGVIVWELLSGRHLFPNMQPSAIVTQLLSGRVPLATIPQGHAWAAPLAGLAARALSADPAKRFASAAAMAAEIRRIAGPRLAPPTRMAAHLRAVFGDRMRARREQLERGETPTAAPPKPVMPVVEEVEEEVPLSAAPTPVPPPPTATTKPPPPVAPPPLPKLAQPAPPKIAVPTPLVPVSIPLAARVPEDLEPGLGEVPVPAPIPARAQSPAPAVPPVVTPVDEPPPAPPRRSRARTLALIAAPLAFAAVVVVWWLAARTPEPARAAAPTPPASTLVKASPPAPFAVPPPSAMQSAVPEAPSAQPPPVAVTNEAPVAPAPEVPAQATPYPSGSQTPAVRPPPRPKYEPEGI